MGNRERWHKAQQYEREWWEHNAPTLDLEYCRAFADDLQHDLADIRTVDDATRILEIGSGAAGTVTGLPGRRFALDPLEYVYGTIPAFKKERDPAVRYLCAQGETLPFRTGSFDLVINDNVLDHCETPERVMAETARVLAPGGIVYFRMNTYHRYGRLVRRTMERFELDRGHPHSFIRRDLERLFAAAGFTAVYTRRSGFLKTWFGDIRLYGLKSMIKSLLFINRDEVLFILRKAPATGRGNAQ